MKREKPVVGQEVFVVHANYGRGDTKTSISKVTKVGRKYFYIDKPDHHGIRYLIETWEQDGWSSHQNTLYFSDDEYRNECLIADTRRQLRFEFENMITALSYDQMKRIMGVLDEKQGA